MKCRVRVCHSLQTVGLHESSENCLAICSNNYFDGYVKIVYSRRLWWLALLVSNAEHLPKRKSGRRRYFVSRGFEQ